LEEQNLEQYPAVYTGVVFPPFVPTAVATHPPFAISLAVSGHDAGSQEET